MDSLTFLSKIAILQSKLARPVTVGELAAETKFSRQYCHRRINELIVRNFVYRISHGKYAIRDNSAVLAIGLCVLTPMDVYEYQSRLKIERGF